MKIASFDEHIIVLSNIKREYKSLEDNVDRIDRNAFDYARIQNRVIEKFEKENLVKVDRAILTRFGV